MKRIAFFIVFLFATTIVPCMAQEQGKHSYEVGAGINAYGILGAAGGPGRTLGPGVHFEYRNSISDRFDLGGRIYYKYGTGESAPTLPEALLGELGSIKLAPRPLPIL